MVRENDRISHPIFHLLSSCSFDEAFLISQFVHVRYAPIVVRLQIPVSPSNSTFSTDKPLHTLRHARS